jgi:hypothetical protein
LSEHFLRNAVGVAQEPKLCIDTALGSSKAVLAQFPGDFQHLPFYLIQPEATLPASLKVSRDTEPADQRQFAVQV